MQTKLGGIPEFNAFLESFNAFHDGFIRSFKTTSKDYFDEVVPPGKVAVGEFDVELEFSHHNFKGSGGKPHRISLLLRDAEELSIAIRKDAHSFSDSSIDRVEIVPGAVSSSFLLSVVSSRHRDGHWAKETIATVRFRAAEFTGPVPEKFDS